MTPPPRQRQAGSTKATAPHPPRETAPGRDKPDPTEPRRPWPRSAGGCIGRAPLGYRNVITTKNGREARIVVVDEVRGPLVAWAFAAYASGEWTLRRLAEELTLRGLTTVPTASLPEKPVTVQLLSKVLHNPFYVGEVVYQGVHYAGSHEPLVDRATYETVQTLLATRVNGERTVKHAHYLKSTIYCGILWFPSHRDECEAPRCGV